MVQDEDTVLNFITPKEFISLQVLESVVSGDKLTHPGLSNVT
jgi:hypothetical protein